MPALATWLAALAAVAALALWMKPERIQRDVERRAQSALADAGFAWATAAARGRDVVIWGRAPDAAHARRAAAVVQSVWGVRGVRDASTEAPGGGGEEAVLQAIQLAVRAMRAGGATADPRVLEQVQRLSEDEARLPDAAPGDTVLEAIRAAVAAMGQDAGGAPALTPRERAAASRPLDAVTCRRLFDGLLAAQPALFDIGSAILRPEAGRLLEQLATVAAHCRGVRLAIAGHTDAAGDRERNVALSGERARAVMTYLVARGVSAGRVSAVGYGPDMPIADNATAEGRARNRRIEIDVIEGEAS